MGIMVLLFFYNLLEECMKAFIFSMVLFSIALVSCENTTPETTEQGVEAVAPDTTTAPAPVE
jgi:hypothetical protein